MTFAEKIAEAQEFRDAWKAAYLATSTGTSYTIGTRTLTRADVAEARQEFFRWDGILRGLQCGAGAGVRIFRVVPRDL